MLVACRDAILQREPKAFTFSYCLPHSQLQERPRLCTRWGLGGYLETWRPAALGGVHGPGSGT